MRARCAGFRGRLSEPYDRVSAVNWINRTASRYGSGDQAPHLTASILAITAHNIRIVFFQVFFVPCLDQLPGFFVVVIIVAD